METLLFRDHDNAVVEEIPRPTPEGDEVLIEVDRVQLSITECNLYRGADIAHSEQVSRRLADGPARLFGHEFCGTIAETGDDVAEFEVGDRIYAPGKIPCQECAYCISGYKNYCPNKTQIGYDLPGALSEYFLLPEDPLCKLPDEVSDAEGAAMQPFESSVRSVATADFTPGSVVAVVGIGVMGYQCAQLADLFGGDRVFAIDIDDEKLEIAEQQGLIPINALEENPPEIIRDETGGIGADIAFEAAGGQQEHGTEGTDPLAQAMQLVRRGGTVVQIGHIIGDIELTPRAIKSKKVDWVQPVSGVTSFSPNMDSAHYAPKLVATGQASISDYITHELEGLDSFDELVDITLNKAEHGALGPAQIIP